MKDIKYTPLFDFYWIYLQSRFKNRYSLVEVLNKIYFREPGYTINETISETEENPDILKLRELDVDMLNTFYQLFEKMLSYKDYKYNYNMNDFIIDYTGEKIPLQYKIAKMTEFVKSDWKILPKYVTKQRRKETLFHFFTNTINLSGRFRRSTRLEDKENPHILFATSAKLTTPENLNALKVVDVLNYDNKYEIFIDDIRLLLPTINVGDYVELSDLVNRYVFAFKNPSDKHLSLKVFIDGILCTDIITINSLGTDYLYLPVENVSENSYIMMELEWVTDDAQLETMTFGNNTEWKVIHLIDEYKVEYTMNDICLKYNGLTLDRNKYTLQLIRNNIQYSMTDERHKITNKYGIVTDVAIQLTGVDTFPASVDVFVNKSTFVSGGVAHKNGYPRFDISKLTLNPSIEYARMYFNGRLTPSNAFRLIDSAGKSCVQSRIFCTKGDQYFFEFSPYTKELICTFDEFDPNAVFDLSKYIDKPLNPEYYEVYVNGRRLGLPNVFPIGPNHNVFKGLKSKYLLSIYEKERDFEYFGYSKIFKDRESYFYTINDLLEEPFMTENEAREIIDIYINMVKHDNAIIVPNVCEEEKLTFEIENGILEEMKIFFFEELLPLGLGDPDTLQFNKTYLSEVFPSFTEVFTMEVPDDDSMVVFLNPDMTVRVHDHTTNDYEVIDTANADNEKAFVMITGESGE